MIGVWLSSAKVNSYISMTKAEQRPEVNYQRREPSIRITSCVLPRRQEALRSNLNATENPPASTSAAPSSPALNRFQALRQLLLSPDLSFLMEAHNGLSAKIVEEAGFQGIWASGLSISASLGVRDNNEASWTQVLEVLEFMADATSIPILVDGDTGFGNFNNVRRLVRKLCERGVAGVCIEDKLFPKTNSFIGDAPAAGRHGRVLRPHPGRQGQPDRRRLLHRRTGRGADRRPGHGRGAAAGGGVPCRRGRRDPDPFQALQRRRDPELHGALGPALPGRHRADDVLRDADRSVPRGRRLDRDLGQPQHPRRDRRDARRHRPHPPTNSRWPGGRRRVRHGARKSSA